MVSPEEFHLPTSLASLKLLQNKTFYGAFVEPDYCVMIWVFYSLLLWFFIGMCLWHMSGCCSAGVSQVVA